MLNARHVRQFLGWSQAKMADYLGCDQSTVCRIERGKKMSGSVRRLLEVLAQRQQARDEAKAHSTLRQEQRA
jgi:transcriptional regulator with XRE-family HTH domain